MRKLWPFRNFANFSLTLIGTTGLGLLYYSISNERVFSNSPVVGQAVKIMGLDDTTRNLLGNPIAYTGSFSNTYSFRDDELYYNFQVKGSKSNTTAELNARKIRVEELNRKIGRVREIQEVIKGKEVERQGLLERSSKLKRNQQNIKKQLSQQIKSLQTQLQTLSTQLKQAQLDKITSLKSYYIPPESLHPQIMRNKNPQSQLPPDQTLYSIANLVTNLPNKNRINVIPSQEDEEAKTNPEKFVERNRKFLGVQRITEGYVRDRMGVGLEGLSQEELENYGKHKTMMMYGKYNGYRLILSVLLTCGLLTVFLTWHIYRIKPVGGTIIAHEAQNLFLNNPKTSQILKSLKKPKNIIKFSKTFEGGKRGDNFKCSVDVDGVPGSKVFFQGREDTGSGRIQFKKFWFEYREGKQIKKVDLL